MAGRKAKPTSLKLIQGNPGKRPINKKEPKPTSKTAIPKWLSDDKVAVEEWERLAPELEALGILTNLDQTLFAQYCDAVSRFRAARAVLRAGGETQTTENGYIQAVPEMATLRKERDSVKSIGSLFGLSPSDRTRIEVDLKLDRGAELAAELMDD